MKPLDQFGCPLIGPPRLSSMDDVAGQVLVLGAQAVHGPAPERRPADERLAGVHLHQGRAVGVAVGVARADHGQLVGVLADVREVIGDHQAALAAGAERAEGRRQKADLAAAGVDELLVRRQRLAGVLLQLGLVVERVDLARAAVHHQEDDALGLRREVRRSRASGLADGVGLAARAARRRSRPLRGAT